MTATHSQQALGTTATICVTAAEALDPARAILDLELVEIDRACSRFRPDSELARLNAASGRELVVGELLFLALETALAAAAETDGLVDPTVGRTLRLAGYDRTFPLVLARDGDRFTPRFAAVPGWRLVVLNAERRSVCMPAGLELDLGATAKGLAADRIATAIHVRTGAGVLVALGGDIAVAGETPPGGWPVLVADDHAAELDAPGAVVAIPSGGLATSGTAVRRWRAGGTTLHHIVDPRTGRPAKTPWRTATVAASSCVDANVASTAAIVLGTQAPDWLSKRRLPARLVSNDGFVETVAGWPAGAAA